MLPMTYLYTSLGTAVVESEMDVRSSVLIPPFDMMPPHKAWYGTRAQTILLVERSTGQLTFVERVAYESKGGIVKWSGDKKQFSFTIGAEQG